MVFPSPTPAHQKKVKFYVWKGLWNRSCALVSLQTYSNMLLSLIAKQILALLLPKYTCRIEVGDVPGMEDESCIKGVILEVLSTAWYGPKTNQTKVQLEICHKCAGGGCSQWGRIQNCTVLVTWCYHTLSLLPTRHFLIPWTPIWPDLWQIIWPYPRGKQLFLHHTWLTWHFYCQLNSTVTVYGRTVILQGTGHQKWITISLLKDRDNIPGFQRAYQKKKWCCIFSSKVLEYVW